MAAPTRDAASAGLDEHAQGVGNGLAVQPGGAPEVVAVDLVGNNNGTFQGSAARTDGLVDLGAETEPEEIEQLFQEMIHPASKLGEEEIAFPLQAPFPTGFHYSSIFRIRNKNRIF